MKSMHVLLIPFTGLGICNGYRGDEWLKDRIKIFKEYTLRSITNQSCQEFVMWFCWRAEEENNPIVLDFVASIEGIRGVQAVHTFHGIPFWDDKYSDEGASARLYGTLSKSLPELEPLIPETVKHVYLTIQPSDDMYLSTMVEDVKKKWPDGYKVFGYSKGYIMDYRTGEIAEYNPSTTPPFYTIKFDTDTFLSPEKHYKFIGPYKSHEYVKDYLNAHYKDERGFVVGTHGRNISTVYNHPYRGETLSGVDRESIMIKTGTLFSEKIIVKDTWRLKIRRLSNLLPFHQLLRNWYNNLPICLKRI